MIKTPLEFVKEYTGYDDEQALYDHIIDLNPDQIENLLAHYREYSTGMPIHSEELQMDEVCPYIPTDSSQPNWIYGDIFASSKTFQEYDHIWKVVDSLKHRLLYCHSIAIDDPLRNILATSSADMKLKREMNAGVIANYFQFLIHLDPLIKEGVLTLVDYGVDYPIDRYVMPEIDGAIGVSNQYQSERLLPTDQEMRLFFKNAPEKVKLTNLNIRKEGNELLTRQAMLIQSLERIKIGLTAFVRGQNKITPYFPTEYDSRLLSEVSRRLANQEVASQLERFDFYQDRIVEELINVELPALEGLSMMDILAVRKSDHFEQWRYSLSNALRESIAVPDSTFNRKVAVRNIISGRLSSDLKALDSATRKSNSLSKFRSGTTAFVTGSISAYITYQLDPAGELFALKTALAGVAGSSIATALLHVEENDKNLAPQALRSHYVAALR